MHILTEWPHRGFDYVPSLGEARDLAYELRQLVSMGEDALDLERCCVLAKIDVRDANLGSSDSRQALLTAAGTQFRIVVNNALSASSVSVDVARRRRRFRIAHELGHTFFYRNESGRIRRRFPSGDLGEERFCDEFARCLLVPPRQSAITAVEAGELSNTYDASLEVVARMVASSQAAPRVGLWWWRSHGRDAAVFEQWLSDDGVRRELAVRPCRTSVRSLLRLLAEGKARLGDSLSVATFEDRRQAMVVLLPWD